MSDVRDLLEELAEDGEARGAGAVFVAATQRAGQRRRTRRRIGIASALASVVAIVVVVSLLAQSTGVHNRVGVEPGATTTTVASATAARLAAGDWSTFPPAPNGARSGAAVVWTGKELVVWGGDARSPNGRAPSDPRADGAAYDPATGTWRVLATSLLGPAVGAVAVWMGEEMLIWTGTPSGRQDPDKRGRYTVQLNAAAYKPSTDSWRAIAAAPFTATIGVWTGDRAVVLGGRKAASYDPGTNTWHGLPPMPAHTLAGFRVFPGGVRLAVSIGPGRVLVWSTWEATRAIGVNETQISGGSDVLRYDESTDGWTALRAGPAAIPEPMEAFWTGSRVLVRGDLHMPGAHGPGPLPEASAWYDPETGRAARLPADALQRDRFSTSPLTSAWTGRALLSLAMSVPRGLKTNTSAYDAATGAWRLLPRAPFSCYESSAVWTGARVLMYCPSTYPAQAHPVGGLEFTPG